MKCTNLHISLVYFQVNLKSMSIDRFGKIVEVYFVVISDEVAHIKVPIHTVFKLTPVAYGCRVEKYSMNEEGELV